MQAVEAIKKDRQAVYGDPWENHQGVGQQWGAILRHHGRHIQDGGAVPASLVAACMAALKLNRMRMGRVHHEDSAIDAIAYTEFADVFRRREVAEPWKPADRQPINGVHRVYVAGPYSAGTREAREGHCKMARHYAQAIMERGHCVHIPHDATHLLSEQAIEDGKPFGYEDWMRLDFSIIDRWATAVFLVARSPGADREVEYARQRGIPVWTQLDEVPKGA